MEEKLAIKNEIQEKLKDAVREKFQELLSDKEIDEFVTIVTDEFKTDMKRKVSEILQIELQSYVKEYIKNKTDTMYKNNKISYDQVIVNAISSSLPSMFEALLGSMIQTAMINASVRNY